MLATFVASEVGLRRFVDGAPPVTDDRPTIEHFLGSLDVPVTAAALDEIAEPSGFELGERVAAQRKLVLATQRQNESRYQDARILVEEAEALAGKNAWTRYLFEITYGCLEPISAGTRAE